MCIVEIRDNDIIYINKTMTKESKHWQTKTKGEKSCFEWLHREPF